MAYTTIKKPSDYFNTKLYTGNATNPTTISGIGFQPDWVWTKLRAGGTEGHRLCDSVRGATKDLLSNTTAAESTNAIGLKSFNSDGYVIGNSNGYNLNSGTFVSWNWLASNTTASNTDGDITSTVSVNTTSGFSILSYSGTGSSGTIGHGLGSPPKFMIIKNRSLTEDWLVYTTALDGSIDYLLLNSTAAKGDSGNALPTNSVFSLGSNQIQNASGSNYIAYCFADVQGFSKFGSYTGNGNADGTFVYTGFKPAFVIIKVTSTTGDWVMIDTKRDTYNPTNKRLFPNLSNAENTSLNPFVDVVSNGFKLKTTSGAYNGSGGSYIYMAFAEEPLVGDNPATAR